MDISKKGEYALKALMYLAKQYGKGPHKIKTIAEKASIPESYLKQILLQLKHSRFVVSVKGAEGGYSLKNPPQEISLGEIVRQVDGALAPYLDLKGLEAKIEEEGNYVGLYSILLDVRGAVSEILDETNLADLCRRNQHIQEEGAKVILEG